MCKCTGPACSRRYDRPVGYRHNREEILAGALAEVTDSGLSQLSFGRVAKRLEITDRMVVYYFPTKDDLLTAVVVELGLQLQRLLEDAFGSDRLPPAELERRAWPVLTSQTGDRVFAAFFELVGLASAGLAPFKTLAPLLVEAWVDWLGPHLESSTAANRRKETLAIVARLDGLLLLRATIGAEAADMAARQLGVVARRSPR